METANAHSKSLDGDSHVGKSCCAEQLRKRLFKALTVLILFFSPMESKANADTPVPLDQLVEHMNIDGRISYFKDESGVLDLLAIREIHRGNGFRRSDDSGISSGPMPNQALWLHITLENPQPQWLQPVWLMITPQAIDSLILYQETPQNQTTSLKTERVIQREYETLGYFFNLGALGHGSHDYYLRLTASTAIKITSSIWTTPAVTRFLLSTQFGFGIYIGTAALLIFISLIRTFTLKGEWDISYLSYLLGFELIHITRSGMPQFWGIVEQPQYMVWTIQLGLLLCAFGFIQLTRTLISWPMEQRGTLRLLTHIRGLFLICMFGALLVSPTRAAELNLITATLATVISLCFILYAAIRNYPNARFMALSFLPFSAFSIYIILSAWIPIPIPDIWLRNRILMVTCTLNMGALLVLIFIKESTIRSKKESLEDEISNLHKELSSQSLLVNIITHELSRPMQKLSMIARHGIQSTNERQKDLKRKLLDIYSEASGLLEMSSQRIRQASFSGATRKKNSIEKLLLGIVRHHQQSQTTHAVGFSCEMAPKSFCFDSKLIGILINNLIENAIKHTPPGGGIWVDCYLQDEKLVIDVVDEGPGIPKEALSKLFDRYFQISTDTQKGMGLGLFICQRIVKLHHGTLTCYSIPGEGSTFKATLSPT